MLDEFKQFLPDITGQPASNLFDTISPTYYSGSKRSVIGTPPPHGMLPPGKKKRTNAVSHLSNEAIETQLTDLFFCIYRLLQKRTSYIKKKMAMFQVHYVILTVILTHLSILSVLPSQPRRLSCLIESVNTLATNLLTKNSSKHSTCTRNRSLSSRH